MNMTFNVGNLCNLQSMIEWLIVNIHDIYFIAGALTKSQFPVFTIYAQKSCLGVRPCERAWCFDRVRGYHLKGRGKKTHIVGSRQMCLDLCLGENEFVCR